MLTFLIFFIGAVVAYWFWVRPILRQQPAFADLFAKEDTFFAALREKLAGAKQKLTTVIAIAAGVIVEVNDFIAPLAQQAGFDVQQLLPKIPQGAWPFITMGFLGLVYWFRKLAEKRGDV